MADIIGGPAVVIIGLEVAAVALGLEVAAVALGLEVVVAALGLVEEGVAAQAAVAIVKRFAILRSTSTGG